MTSNRSPYGSAASHCQSVRALPLLPLQQWLTAASLELALGPVEHCLTREEANSPECEALLAHPLHAVTLGDDVAAEELVAHWGGTAVASSDQSRVPRRVFRFHRASAPEVLQREVCGCLCPSEGRCSMHTQTSYAAALVPALSFSCCPSLWWSSVLKPWVWSSEPASESAVVDITTAVHRRAFVAGPFSLCSSVLCWHCDGDRYRSSTSLSRSSACRCIPRDGKGRWLLLFAAVLEEVISPTHCDAATTAWRSWVSLLRLGPTLPSFYGTRETALQQTNTALLRRVVRELLYSATAGATCGSSWWTEAIQRALECLKAHGAYIPLPLNTENATNDAEANQFPNVSSSSSYPSLECCVRHAIRTFLRSKIPDTDAQASLLEAMLVQFLFQPHIGHPSVSVLRYRLHMLLHHPSAVFAVSYHSYDGSSVEEAGAGGLRGSSSMTWSSRSSPLPVELWGTVAPDLLGQTSSTSSCAPQGGSQAWEDDSLPPLLLPCEVILLPVESMTLFGEGGYQSLASISGGYQHPAPVHLTSAASSIAPGHAQEGVGVLLLRIDPTGDWLVSSERADTASVRLQAYNQRSFHSFYANDETLVLERETEVRRERRNPHRARERHRRRAQRHSWASQTEAGAPCSVSSESEESEEEGRRHASEFVSMEARQQGKREISHSERDTDGHNAMPMHQGYFENLVDCIYEEVCGEWLPQRTGNVNSGSNLPAKNAIRVLVWCALHHIRCVISPERCPSCFHELAREYFHRIVVRVDSALQRDSAPAQSSLHILDGLRQEYVHRLSHAYRQQSPSRGLSEAECWLATQPVVVCRDGLRLIAASAVAPKGGTLRLTFTSESLPTLEATIQQGAQGRLDVEQVHFHVAAYLLGPAPLHWCSNHPPTLSRLPNEWRQMAWEEQREIAEEAASASRGERWHMSVERFARHYQYHVQTAKSPSSQLLMGVVVLHRHPPPPIPSSLNHGEMIRGHLLLPARTIRHGRVLESLLLRCAASLWHALGGAEGRSDHTGWVVGGGGFSLALSKALREMVKDSRAASSAAKALPFPSSSVQRMRETVWELLSRALLSVPQKLFRYTLNRIPGISPTEFAEQGLESLCTPLAGAAPHEASLSTSASRGTLWRWQRRLQAFLDDVGSDAGLPLVRLRSISEELRIWTHRPSALDPSDRGGDSSTGDDFESTLLGDLLESDETEASHSRRTESDDKTDHERSRQTTTGAAVQAQSMEVLESLADNVDVVEQVLIAWSRVLDAAES